MHHNIPVHILSIVDGRKNYKNQWGFSICLGGHFTFAAVHWVKVPQVNQRRNGVKGEEK
jgi:hypothetical protein